MFKWFSTIFSLGALDAYPEFFWQFLNIGVIRQYFWTSRGQLLRNKHIIPVTNIAELVEYVLPPRALNTFLDGLAELGVDKGLIKNKKLPSDLVEKEKG